MHQYVLLFVKGFTKPLNSLQSASLYQSLTIRAILRARITEMMKDSCPQRICKLRKQVAMPLYGHTGCENIEILSYSWEIALP